MKRYLVLLTSLSALAVVGCGTVSHLQTLPEKTTPATTRIKVELTRNTGLNIAGALSGDSVVDNTKAELEEQLIERNIALPVTGDNYDMLWSGELRTGALGFVIHWRLMTKDGTIVKSGEADTDMMNSASAFVKDISADLLELDIDAYASGGPAVIAAKPNKAPTRLVPQGDPVPEDANAWAVIVGIEQYRSQVPAAKHAVADADAFEVYATHRLGVPKSHIKKLTGDFAGRSDMASAIEEWLPRNVVDKKSKVYFYFSGHGAPDVETGDAYLVPYDADPAYLKTRGYSVSKLYKNLDALPGTAYAFVDACFSGSGDRSVLADGTRPLVPVKEAPAEPGVVAFSAASSKQTTGAAQDASHGLFSYYLMLGLGGEADSNGDGHVALDELDTFVSTRVEEEARLQNREQKPTLTLPTSVKPSKVVLVK